LNLSDIVAPNIFEVQISSNQPKSSGCSISGFRRLRQILARVIKYTIPLRTVSHGLVKKLAIMRRLPVKYRRKVLSPAKVAPAEKINPYPIRRTEAVDVYESSSSTMPKLKHDIHHKVILPSENGRKPKTQASAMSPINT
jgi:hypothetical protein